MVDASISAVFVFLAGSAFANIYAPRQSRFYRVIPILLTLAAIYSAFVGIEAPISPFANNVISLAGAILLLAAGFLNLRKEGADGR